MLLDNRLMAIASLVRKNSFVCDVGTDHAYIPIYLAQNGISQNIIACDIAIKPLESAAKNIADNNLTDKIKTVLSNGLENVPSNIEDIIIAGMGAELICNIISASAFIKDKDKRLILQPMTHTPFLRKQLYSMGFEIEKEIPIIEDKHTYTVILSRYVAKTEDISEVFSIIGKIPNTQYGNIYIRRYIDKLKAITKGIENSSQKQDISFYNNLINDLEGIMLERFDKN
ncbi:MAG: class I SAM-dependent methyltransferase [Oscillospiraceae bacterium]